MAQDKTFGSLGVKENADIEGNASIDGISKVSESRGEFERTVSMTGRFPDGTESTTQTIDLTEFDITAGELRTDESNVRVGNSVVVEVSGYNGFNGNNGYPAYIKTILRSELDGDTDTIDNITSLNGGGGTGGFSITIASVNWSGTGDNRTLDSIDLQITDSGSDILDSGWIMKISQLGTNFPNFDI